jgi:hypothetical protein
VPSLRIALLSFFLVGCPTEPDVETVTVTCDDPLDGHDWGDGAPADAEPGVEDELAALDLSSLPDEVDVSGLSPLFRGYLAYALETPPDELGDSVNRDEALAHGELGEVALGSLLLGQEDPTGIDFFFFRRGFQRYSVCSTGLPVTLDGFKATFGDHEAIDGEVVDSDAKCTDRRLRANHGDQVFVAETLVDGVVRETEVLLGETRTDGAFAFAVYDEAGDLTDRSLFPTIAGEDHVVAAAPYACMTCHLNTTSTETWRFDVLTPTGTGPCAD